MEKASNDVDFYQFIDEEEEEPPITPPILTPKTKLWCF